MSHHDQHHDKPGMSGRTKWILIGFLAVGGFFLFTEHRAHLYGALPYLLILACPLMHLFHSHGGHGSSHGTRDIDAGQNEHDHRKGQS